MNCITDESLALTQVDKRKKHRSKGQFWGECFVFFWRIKKKKTLQNYLENKNSLFMREVW